MSRHAKAPIFFPGLLAAPLSWASGTPRLEIVEQALEELRKNPEVKNKSTVGVVDYSLHSSQKRFFIINAVTKKIVSSYHVAHGKGSDKDHTGYLTVFDDVHNTYNSVLGTFVTGKTRLSSNRDHGMTMKLHGISETNRNAFDRFIIIHAAPYVEKAWLAKYLKAGRSHGCLAFAKRDRDEVLRILGSNALILSVK